MNHEQLKLMSRAQLETQRLAAAVDLLHMRQADIARRYGVTRTTASRWARALRKGGPDALKLRKATGRPRLLTPEQLLMVREMYSAMSSARRCTIAKLTEAIEERFGIHFAADHVGRILHEQLGFPRFQKPRVARAAS